MKRSELNYILLDKARDIFNSKITAGSSYFTGILPEILKEAEKTTGFKFKKEEIKTFLNAVDCTATRSRQFIYEIMHD